MNNKSYKFLMISVGGIIGLMIIGMVIALFSISNPNEIKNFNLIDDWMYYRISFYCLVVIFWRPISWFLLNYCTQQDREFVGSDLKNLVNLRLKIIALFTFVEIVIIQQIGL